MAVFWNTMRVRLIVIGAVIGTLIAVAAPAVASAGIKWL